MPGSLRCLPFSPARTGRRHGRQQSLRHPTVRDDRRLPGRGKRRRWHGGRNHRRAQRTRHTHHRQGRHLRWIHRHFRRRHLDSQRAHTPGERRGGQTEFHPSLPRRHHRGQGARGSPRRFCRQRARAHGTARQEPAHEALLGQGVLGLSPRVRRRERAGSHHRVQALRHPRAEGRREVPAPEQHERPTGTVGHIEGLPRPRHGQENVEGAQGLAGRSVAGVFQRHPTPAHGDRRPCPGRTDAHGPQGRRRSLVAEDVDDRTDHRRPRNSHRCGGRA